MTIKKRIVIWYTVWMALLVGIAAAVLFSASGALLRREIIGELEEAIYDAAGDIIVKGDEVRFDDDLDFFDENTVHIHIPEGAVPKDGPSAGITLFTALWSMFRKETIKPCLAMTGELTLTGQVMPIGGLKEKVLAARRNGIREIIIPEKN